MDKKQPTDPAPKDADLLVLSFRGRRADEGSLLLDEYAESLSGWRGLLQLLGEIHLSAEPHLKRLRGEALLRIEVVGERRGSWEAIIGVALGAMATGIIGNRADAAATWAFKRFLRMLRAVIIAYLRQKRESTGIRELANTLRDVLDELGVSLSQDVSLTDDQQRLFPARDDDIEEIELRLAAVDRMLVLADRLDQLLKAATAALDQSCERLTVIAGKIELLEIAPDDRAVIRAELTPPAPERNWIRKTVEFDRINRRTGRALFRFAGEEPDTGAHYSRIIDPAVRKPGNRYTQAFNEAQPIEVHLRQAAPERGRLNLQWEIGSGEQAKVLFEQG